MSTAPTGIDQGLWNLALAITAIQQLQTVAVPTPQQIAAVQALIGAQLFGGAASSAAAVQTPPG